MNVLGLDVDVRSVINQIHSYVNECHFVLCSRRSKRIFYSDVAAKTLHSAYIVGNSITRVETLVGNITNQGKHVIFNVIPATISLMHNYLMCYSSIDGAIHFLCSY